jgi:hypothetical protein
MSGAGAPFGPLFWPGALEQFPPPLHADAGVDAIDREKASAKAGKTAKPDFMIRKTPAEIENKPAITHYLIWN